MSNIFGYIYLITNLTKFKMYVGKHMYKKEGLDPNYLCSTTNKEFYQDYREYGSRDFTVEIIDLCYSQEDLNQSEKDIIEYYRIKYGRSQLYNIADGGEGGRTWQNYKDTDPEKYEQIIAKLSASISKGLDKYYSIGANRIKHRDSCRTEEARKNYSEASYKRLRDPDFIRMMDDIKSDSDYRRRMSSSIKEKWTDPEYRDKLVEVHNSESTKLKCSEAAKRGHSDPELAVKYRHPNKKYLFRLPDGSEVIRSKPRTILRCNPDWVLLGLVSNDHADNK